MTIPPFLSESELDAAGKLVVPNEPVVASAPNRGTLAAADSVDFLALLQRAHQTLVLSTAPAMTWDQTALTLTLGDDLVLRYVVDDPEQGVAVVRSVTLRRGTWRFNSANLLVVPIGIESSISITAGRVATPSIYGTAQYFTDEGAAQQFYRAQTQTNGRDAALRYINFARRVGTSLVLFNGLVLRDGVTVENLVDAEYAGFAADAALKQLINEDRNILLTGAGTTTFTVSGSNRVVATASGLDVHTANNAITRVNNIAGGITLTPTNPVLAVALNRVAGTTTTVSAVTTNWSGIADTGDNTVVLGYWDQTEDIFRFREGSGYRPGDSYVLGAPFALSATYLIEIINTELIYPADANAFAGIPAGSTRLAWVITGSDRQILRPVTYESIQDSGPGGLPVEVIRLKRLVSTQIDPSDVGRLDIILSGGTTFYPVRMDRAELDSIRGRTVTEIPFRDLADSAYIDTRAAQVIGQTRLVSNVVRARSLATAIAMQDAAGSPATVNLGTVSISSSTGVVNNSGTTLTFIDTTTVSGFSNTRHQDVIADGALRTDGNNTVAGSQVRGVTSISFRNAADSAFINGRANRYESAELQLFSDATLTTLRARLRSTLVSGSTRVEVQSSGGLTSIVELGVGKVATEQLRTLDDTFLYVATTSNDGSALRGIQARDVVVGDAGAVDSFGALASGEAYVADAATRSLTRPFRASQFTLGPAPAVPLVTLNWDSSDNRLEVLDADGSDTTDFNDVAASAIFAQNVPVAVGTVSYSGTWQVTSSTIPGLTNTAAFQAVSESSDEITVTASVLSNTPSTQFTGYWDDGGTRKPAIGVLEVFDQPSNTLTFSVWDVVSGAQLTGADLQAAVITATVYDADAPLAT